MLLVIAIAIGEPSDPMRYFVGLELSELSCDSCLGAIVMVVARCCGVVAMSSGLMLSTYEGGGLGEYCLTVYTLA